MWWKTREVGERGGGEGKGGGGVSTLENTDQGCILVHLREFSSQGAHLMELEPNMLLYWEYAAG